MYSTDPNFRTNGVFNSVDGVISFIKGLPVYDGQISFPVYIKCTVVFQGDIIAMPTDRHIDNW